MDPARYEVLRPLASGGMAEVFLARAKDSDRLVVLKKLHPRLSIEPEYVQMFLDEAVIASKLHHPNLVEVYELGLDGEQHYIAMEHLHGHDLSRTLRRLRIQRVPLMFQQAITIVRDVAAGLHYAHERVGDDGNLLQIIHRDVSPHNIVLTYAGEVKVVDFGVAKASSQIARTRTGVLKGKTAYMSPEQAMGEPVDRRTDVFSIGILLWELTTGRWLYRRRTELEMLKAVVESDAPRPSSLRHDYPADLEKIVMKALARSADQRWATAGELRSALDDLARRWHFQASPSAIAELMKAAFVDEVTAWEQARAAGTSLADHLATARADVVDQSAEPLATEPEDGVAFETRPAPPAPADRAAAPPVAPPRAWWRQRRVLAVALAAAALAVAVVAVIAVVSRGGGGSSPAPAGGADRPAGSARSFAPPPIETLDLSRPARPDPPDAAPAPPPGPAPDPQGDVPIVHPPPDPGAKAGVPIVHPPPDPDPRRPGRVPSRSGPRADAPSPPSGAPDPDAPAPAAPAPAPSPPAPATTSAPSP